MSKKSINGKDWWLHPAAASTLLRWLVRHVMSLQITYVVDGKPHVCRISGTLVEFDGEHFWVTSGHVIAAIRKILKSPNVYELKSCWYDNCENREAASIPVDISCLTVFHHDDEHHDLALVLLGKLEVSAIEALPTNQFFNEEAWRGIGNASPDGYYLIGFPGEYQSLERVGESKTSVYFQPKSFIVSLPVRKIETPENDSRNFWNREGAFYGQLVHDKGDEKIGVPKDIKGMSGGPVVSVERTQDGEIKYRLIGIQSSWLSGKRIICAESILAFQGALDYCFSSFADEWNEMSDEEKQARLSAHNPWKGNILD